MKVRAAEKYAELFFIIAEQAPRAVIENGGKYFPLSHDFQPSIQVFPSEIAGLARGARPAPLSDLFREEQFLAENLSAGAEAVIVESGRNLQAVFIARVPDHAVDAGRHCTAGEGAD